MTHVTRFVVACVRGWTRIYTLRLPPSVRDARREQIESDLWESAHDAQVASAELVVQMLVRLTLGISDDLAWRFAQVSATRITTLRAVPVAVLMCMLLLFAGLWRLTPGVLPLPEAPVDALRVHRTANPPPPPSPAPAARRGDEPVFLYGRTSYSLVTDGPPPVPITEVQPVYPPVAVAAGLEGQVLVRARITPRGRITDVEVAPDGILGQSAIDAVRRWEFAPAAAGTPHPALLSVRVTFERAR